MGIKFHPYTRARSTTIRSRNPIKKIKKIKFHPYTRARSTPIRSRNPIKKIEKKSNFTCTLEHDQPPSDQEIRSKKSKKIKFHLYTRARSTPIRSKNLIKKIKKKSNFTRTLEHDQPPSDQKNQISPVH